MKNIEPLQAKIRNWRDRLRGDGSPLIGMYKQKGNTLEKNTERVVVCIKQSSQIEGEGSGVRIAAVAGEESDSKKKQGCRGRIMIEERSCGNSSHNSWNHGGSLQKWQL